MKNFLYIFFLLIPIAVFSQDGDNAVAPVKRNCATMEVLDRLKLEDPSYQQRLNEIEKQIEEYLKQNPQTDNLLVSIPVVVHVVYKTSAQNISTTQIQSQINILNQDFTKTNPDVSGVPSAFQSLVANCQLNFCLATRDPNGAATTGITRTATNKTSFSTNDFVKYSSRGGKDAWPRDKYLNIWVCNLSNGILGYAQFPGGPAATDGVVINYKAFGNTGTAVYPFNKGRTATHEIGHWINLRHIWGDDGISCSGSDQVSDTPNQADENYGCPSFPAISCSNGPNGDMFMNYMDYTDDRCMYMFTNGQSSRMSAALNGTRSAILSSNGCSAPLVSGNGEIDAPGKEKATFTLEQNNPNPFNPSTVINFSLKTDGFVTIKVYNVSGKEVASIINSYMKEGAHSVNFNASSLPSGVYYYKLSDGIDTRIMKMILLK